MVLMFKKKKKATKKNEDLMKKAPAAGAVELGDDVLDGAAGGAMISALRVVNNSTESASEDAADFFWLHDSTGVWRGTFDSRAAAESYAEKHSIE